ncbi:metal ABC transporter substrate-binding protein [Clostridium thermarum]|uniref:metal ABC transporter substrate-binding protein n=1 Tax=Clostridium thermarum TaxID=1716543 RepID=UPI001120EB8E|nr:zinc ABC transporter substrate-binding protein [Clostridium thermarum]
MRRVINLAVAFSFLLSGCNKMENTPMKPETMETPETPVVVEQKIEVEEFLRIVTSDKLLYHMVKDIVKDKHNVDYMMDTEEEQRSFVFTKDSLENIATKDIFIYFGTGFEPWVDKFVEQINKDRVTIINSTRGVRLLTLDKPKSHGDIKLTNNPYFWFDIDDYKIVLSNIKTAIQEKDPKRREVYEENFKEAIKHLDEIDSKFLEDIKDYKEYTYIALNDNLDYLFGHIDIKPFKLSKEEDVQNLQEEFKNKADTQDKYVLLYDDEAELASYEGLINNESIKRIKMNKYSKDKSIIEMIEENYSYLREQLIMPE